MAHHHIIINVSKDIFVALLDNGHAALNQEEDNMEALGERFKLLTQKVAEAYDTIPGHEGTEIKP